MSTTRLFFARAVMWQCGQHENVPAVEQGLVAVGTGEDSTAHWNMLDTTEPWPNSTDYNSVGVKNYATSTDGVEATVKTLRLSYYTQMYNAIIHPPAGLTALEWCRLFSRTPWGGIGDLLPFEIVQEYNSSKRDYVHDRTQLVGGPGPWLYQSNGQPMGAA